MMEKEFYWFVIPNLYIIDITEYSQFMLMDNELRFYVLKNVGRTAISRSSRRNIMVTIRRLTIRF